MKRNYHILLITCLALLMIAGCRKPNNKRTTDINTTPVNTGGQPPLFPGGTQPSLRELFKDLRYTPEKQCVTAGVLQVVTFSKGTRLTFYPNSFKDAAGNIITSGTVCMEMIEMYKPGDMIANMATTTTTGGDLLRSGGQVYINATKDGQTVYANKYGIAFKQPSASSEPMSLYYGGINNKDSLLKWTQANTSIPGTTAAATVPDSLLGSRYIFDSCTDFHFINCDQLNEQTSPRTVVKIILPDSSFNDQNTRVFVILPGINGVVAAVNYSSSLHSLDVGSDHPLHEVPTGMVADIIVMTVKNDKYYYSEQTGLTVTAGMTVNATMTEQSLDYIKTRLGAL